MCGLEAGAGLHGRSLVPLFRPREKILLLDRSTSKAFMASRRWVGLL
ncbi:MAG: hypothetical protein MZV64_11550 [Ignavibacteriales bacterium]|nr:hypothetical protein [Ignavibacteriales bacterium]